jgi:uncharacterized delta-60 repeat protein
LAATIVLLHTLFAVFPFYVQSQNIELDSSFAEEGRLFITSLENCEIFEITIDNSENVYTAGFSTNGSDNIPKLLTLTKCSAEGVLDPEFGQDGISVIEGLDLDDVRDIKIGNSGEIYVSGIYVDETIERGFVAKFNSTGNLDLEFADLGFFTSQFNFGSFNTVLLGDDDTIYLAGNINVFNGSFDDEFGHFIKINSAGEVDTSFGENGLIDFGAEGFHFIHAESIYTQDNKILSVGTDKTENFDDATAYCSHNLDGSPTLNFGDNGIVSLNLAADIPPTLERGMRITPRANGQYFLEGRHYQRFVMRINEDGSIDETYGENGIRTFSTLFWYSAIQDDGKIIIARSLDWNDDLLSYIFQRIDFSGEDDISFGENSIFEVNISSGDDNIREMQFYPPSTLYVIGTSELEDNSVGTIVKFKLDDELSTSNSLMPNSIKVYPNPFTKEIYFQTDMKINKISILDAIGREVAIKQEESRIVIEEGIPSGLYFLKAETEDGFVTTHKLVKE